MSLFENTCMQGKRTRATFNMAAQNYATFIESYLFVGARPEHGQQVDTGNGRSQVSTDGLDVEVQLGTLHALDHWDPQDAHQHHHTHEYTAHTHNVQGGAVISVRMYRVAENMIT